MDGCTVCDFKRLKYPNVKPRRPKIEFPFGKKSDVTTTMFPQSEIHQVKIQFWLDHEWDAGSFFTKCNAMTKSSNSMTMDLYQDGYDPELKGHFFLMALLYQRHCMGLFSEDEMADHFKGVKIHLEHNCNLENKMQLLEVPLPNLNPLHFHDHVAEMVGLKFILHENRVVQIDGKKENSSQKLAEGSNTVYFYNVHDQCQPVAGYDAQHFYQLVFYLPANGFCGGDGKLFCFPGQMDISNKFQGLYSALPYRMPNIRNNIVAVRCAQLQRENGYMEEHPKWHGILVHANYENVTIQLSTTNITFVVRRKDFDELLVLKLASSKDTISFLSREIGPRRDFTTDDHHAEELTEKHNRIHVVGNKDTIFLEAYFKDQPKGNHLRKYTGIWSLGLDMLPMEDNDQIHFHVKMSKCCQELDSWFMLPSSRPPNLEERFAMKRVPLANNFMRIGNRMKFLLRGKFFEKAEEVDFLFRNCFKDVDDPKILAATVHIKFYEDGTSRAKVQQSNMKKTVNGMDYYKFETIGRFYHSAFVRNGHFRIEFAFIDNALAMEINCEQMEIYNFTLPFVHEDVYNLSMSNPEGELAWSSVELYDFSVLETGQIRAWDIGVERGGGVLFLGQMSKDGEQPEHFSICFRQTVNGPWLFLCFKADMEKKEYSLRTDLAFKTEELHIPFDDTIGFAKEEQVEFYIQFTEKDDQFRVWIKKYKFADQKRFSIGSKKQKVNSQWAHIADYGLENVKNESLVDFVQLLGNFENIGDLNPPTVTPNVPFRGENTLTQIIGGAYEINGVVLPPAKKKMNVRFKTGLDDLIICFQFDFQENTLTLVEKDAEDDGFSSGENRKKPKRLFSGEKDKESEEKLEKRALPLDYSEEAGKPDREEKKTEKNPLKVGKDFSLQIRIWEDNTDWDWKYTIKVDGQHFLTGNVPNLEKTRKTEVNGDLLLFSAPGFYEMRSGR